MAEKEFPDLSEKPQVKIPLKCRFRLHKWKGKEKNNGLNTDNIVYACENCGRVEDGFLVWGTNRYNTVKLRGYTSPENVRQWGVAYKTTILP